MRKEAEESLRCNVRRQGMQTPRAVLCLVAQSCLTLCDPVDCSLAGSSVHEDSPGKNTGMGCHALLQGIFPTQVSRIAGGLFTISATREAQSLY